MHLRQLTALLATTAMLAVPGAALAQSAGDEQYSDPFAGEEDGGGQTDGSGGGSDDESGGGGSGGSGSGSGGGGGSSGGDSSSGSSGGGSSDGVESTASSSEDLAQSDDGPVLARTGAETGIIALGGASLLLAGIALRLRLRELR